MKNQNRWILLAAVSGVLSVPALAEKGHHAEKAKAGHAAKGAVICPVMKAPVHHPEKAQHLLVNNEPVHVCCPGCIDEIKKSPAKYLKQTKDPVSGKPFTVTAKSPRMEHGGALFLFSSPQTHEKFHAAPAKYARTAKAHGASKGHGHAQPKRGK